MKTMALTEETAPRSMHSKVLSVVQRSRPQSSAFKMRSPGDAWRHSVCLVSWLGN